MSKISLVLMNLLLLFSGFYISDAQEGSQKSEIPYIYYYSGADHGFIIEHADGSDQHFLPAPLKSPDHNLLGGPGWSPSGKWLAWWSRQDAGNITRTSALGYIVSSDGQEQLDILDEITNIVEMEWSPGGDYLSVLTTLTLTNNPDGYGIYLFDVNAQQMIAHYDVLPDAGLDTLWSPDGQTLVVRYNNPSGTGHIDLVKTDGTHSERQSTLLPFRVVHWLPDGRLGYVDQDANQLILEDLSLEDTTEIPLNDPNIIGIEWSPDGQQALYFVATPDEREYEATLWLLHADGTQTLIAPNVDTDISTPMWSPDGQQVVFAQNVQGESSIEQTKQYVLYNLQTQETHIITPPANPSTFLQSYSRYATHIAWGKATLWLSTDEGVYRYANGTTEVIENAISSPFPSPDERTLLFKGNCTGRESLDSWESPPCLLDQVSGTVHMLAPASQTYHMPFKSFQADWHPASEWVLLEEYAQPGGSFYPQVSIATRDGSFHRELTGFCHSKSCYGWLPDNVTAFPPSSDPVLNRPPDQVLRGHTDWVIAVAWSADGSKVASLDQHGEIILWEVATSTVLQHLYPGEEQVYLETGVLGWNADGTRLASWGYNEWLQEEWGTTIWDVETGTVITQIDTESRVIPWEENTPLPFTPDIVAGDGLIIDIEGEHIAIAPFSGYGRLNNALSPNGAYLFNIGINFSDCSQEPVLTIQNTTTGEIETQTLETPRHCLGFIAPSPDKKWLGAVQNGIVIWNLEISKIVFQNYTQGNSATFSPNSTHLAVASSYEVRIWSLSQQ